MFKNLTQFASLLRHAGQLSSKAHELKIQLKEKRVHGSVDDGRVAVQLNGLGQVLVVTIAPELIHRDHQSRLEELIQTATNQALTEARKLHIEAFHELTGGVELPGMKELLSDLL